MDGKRSECPVDC